MLYRRIRLVMKVLSRLLSELKVVSRVCPGNDDQRMVTSGLEVSTETFY